MKFTDLLANPSEIPVEKSKNLDCFSLAVPFSEVLVNHDTPVGTLKTFSSPFGPVIWNRENKTIECLGAVFSEMEMHDMRDSGLGITDIDLAIRRNFPGGMEIRENNYYQGHL